MLQSNYLKNITTNSTLLNTNLEIKNNIKEEEIKIKDAKPIKDFKLMNNTLTNIIEGIDKTENKVESIKEKVEKINNKIKKEFGNLKTNSTLGIDANIAFAKNKTKDDSKQNMLHHLIHLHRFGI